MILSKFLSQKNKDKIKKFFFIFKCRLRRTVRFVIPFENKHKKELNFAVLKGAIAPSIMLKFGFGITRFISMPMVLLKP